MSRASTIKRCGIVTFELIERILAIQSNIVEA